jgi:hypothetical protein
VKDYVELESRKLSIDAGERLFLESVQQVGLVFG